MHYKKKRKANFRAKNGAAAGQVTCDQLICFLSKRTLFIQVHETVPANAGRNLTIDRL